MSIPPYFGSDLTRPTFSHTTSRGTCRSGPGGGRWASVEGRRLEVTSTVRRRCHGRTVTLGEPGKGRCRHDECVCERRGSKTTTLWMIQLIRDIKRVQQEGGSVRDTQWVRRSCREPCAYKTQLLNEILVEGLKHGTAEYQSLVSSILKS